MPTSAKVSTLSSKRHGKGKRVKRGKGKRKKGKKVKEVREVKAVCFMAKNKKISQILRYFKILFIPLHSLLRLWRNW